MSDRGERTPLLARSAWRGDGATPRSSRSEGSGRASRVLRAALATSGAVAVLGVVAVARARGLDAPADVAPALGEIELSEEENKIYELLGSDEMQIDQIISQAGLPAPVTSTTLMKLEMKKLVKQLPGKHFVKLL